MKRYFEIIQFNKENVKELEALTGITWWELHSSCMNKMIHGEMKRKSDIFHLAKRKFNDILKEKGIKVRVI